jgi:hypothetical protein
MQWEQHQSTGYRRKQVVGCVLESVDLLGAPVDIDHTRD